MYAVVGCSECSALWILDGQPDRTECPRCGRSHSADRLKRFVETDDKDHAREVRASTGRERATRSPTSIV